MKDARSGPGLKSMSRIRSRQQLNDNNDLITDTQSPGGAKLYSQSPGGAKLHTAADRSVGSLLRNSSSMFIDSDYWTP